MQIFVINGFPGSGKSTFGSLAAQEFSALDVSFVHVSSIDVVKEALKPVGSFDRGKITEELWHQLQPLKTQITHKDWDGITKDEFWRAAMAGFKQLIADTHPTLLHDWVIEHGKRLGDDAIVFVDIREPKYIDEFKNRCDELGSGINVKTLLIRSATEQRNFNNPADQEIQNYEYDITFHNPIDPKLGRETNMEALRESVKTFVRSCRPELRLPRIR